MDGMPRPVWRPFEFQHQLGVVHDLCSAALRRSTGKAATLLNEAVVDLADLQKHAVELTECIAVAARKGPCVNPDDGACTMTASAASVGSDCSDGTDDGDDDASADL